MVGGSLDEAQEWLRSWTAQVSRQAEAATALSDQVAGMASTAESLDGAIRVRVDGAGRLVGLDLSEPVRDLAAGELAQLIQATVARAQYRLNAQVAEAVAGTVGTDSETGRAVLASFAQQYPDPEAETGDGEDAAPEPDRR